MSEIDKGLVTGLSSADDGARAIAATEIYRTGRARADKAIHEWWQNIEFAGLCGARPAVIVGLAVRPDTFAKIREANDWPRLAEVPAEQDASEFELSFPGDVHLDVLTTRDPGGDGAISKFLKKQGEAIQQVEIRCGNVARATEILREAFGVGAVYPETRPGADGTRVNFFLIPASDGTKVLVELFETAAPDS
jgi:hypothetical protein